MTSVTHSFDDAVGYERFMGRWSRPLGQKFLGWLSVPKKMRWLDVGCGTGIFTQAILETCSPETVVGVDCAEAQIDHARHSEIGRSAEFRVADAQRLPFGGASFDVVASLLTINFLPDRARALSEMRRVAELGGVVAACVWDFVAELSPSWPLRRGMRRMGLKAAPVPGAEESGLHALIRLFGPAGFADVEHTSIEVEASFADFEEFWRAQTPSYAPTTKAIAQMSETGRAKLKEAVRAELPILADERIVYRARANAVSGRVHRPTNHQP